MATAGCPNQGLVPCRSSHLPAPQFSSVEQYPRELRHARWGTCHPPAVRRASPGPDGRVRRCGMPVGRWHPARADGGVGGSGTAEGGGVGSQDRPQGDAVSDDGRVAGDGAVPLDETQRRMAELFGRMMDSTGEGEAQAQAASDDLVSLLRPDMRKRLFKALFATSAQDTEKSRALFEFADANRDGVIDTREFSVFLENTRAANAEDATVRPLTSKELKQLFSRSAIGNIGFGFVDNSVMVCAGDLIEVTLGTHFGISMLMAAGLGNAVSDIIGTICREKIEEASALFMPELALSSYQMATRPARWAEMSGSCIGVTVGCLLGLTPLLVIEAYGRSSGESTGGGSSAGAGAGTGSSPRSTRPSTRTPTMATLRPDSSSSTAALWGVPPVLEGPDVRTEWQTEGFVGVGTLDHTAGKGGPTAGRRCLSLGVARAGARGEGEGNPSDARAHDTDLLTQRAVTVASCAVAQGYREPQGAAVAAVATREMVTQFILIASAIMAGRRIWRILHRDRNRQPWDR